MNRIQIHVKIIYSLQSGECSIFRGKKIFQPTLQYTVCPRSLRPFYRVRYYIIWVKPSWTYSRCTVNNKNPHTRLDEHNMVEMSGRYLYLLPAFLLLSYIPSFVAILVNTIQRFSVSQKYAQICITKGSR